MTVDRPDHRAIERAIWGPERRALTIGLAINVVASAFEALAVATVLPGVVRDIGGLELYGWAFSAYLLSSLVGIALAGAATDARGPALPLVAGTALFAVGLAISGMAASMPVVVAGRFIQGFGSGAISAIGYAAIGRAYPVDARPRMLALLSSAWVVPGLIGPALAGLVSDHLGWRWGFLGIAPLVVLGTALSIRPLVRLASGPGEDLTDEPAAVPAGSGSGGILPPLALAGGAALLLAALRTPAQPAWGMAALGLVLALPALHRLLPAGTLRLRRGTPAAVALMGAIGFAFFAAEAFLPLALSSVRGLGASAAGLPLTAGTLCWTVGSWIQAREAHHRGRRELAASGVLLVALGIALASATLRASVPVAFATAGWAVAGLGIGIAYSTTALVILETPGPDAGSASAALQLAWTLGIALGTGLGGALVAAAAAAGRSTATGIALVDATALAALVGGLVAAGRLPGRVRHAGVPGSSAGPGTTRALDH